MWWLLLLAAAVTGLSATASVAGYVAVTRYGLLEAVLALALRRGLRGLTLAEATNRALLAVKRVKGGNL